MRGSIDSQQTTTLLRKQQQQQHERRKEKSISLKSNLILPISPSRSRGLMGRSIKDCPKRS
jgi:hypothetical protein